MLVALVPLGDSGRLLLMLGQVLHAAVHLEIVVVVVVGARQGGPHMQMKNALGTYLPLRPYLQKHVSGT